MPIIAKKPESEFIPCPEGLHHAVCVDVVDLGFKSTQWGEKHKIRIVWQIEDLNAENGRRFDARKQYNLSLHEKATLRKDLESWRGRKFTDIELRAFDVETVIGVNGQIQIVQELGEDGSIWANVQAVVPAPKNVPKLIPLEYVRDKDRPKPNGNGATKPGGEDVPF